MGWFCTTSFGGDAFQMGSVESFFTLLLSPLHLALSLTAWWSPPLSLSLSLSLSVSLSLSLCQCTQAVTHSCAHICDKTHSGNHMHVHVQTRLKDGHRCALECAHTQTHTRKDIQTYWNTNQTACGVLVTHFHTCACCVLAHTLTHRRYHTL